MIAPILLCGPDVTGFEKHDLLEKLCTQFYKIILKAKKSTPNIILYGELGRVPISISIKSRMIAFWQRLIIGKQDKISSKLYSIILAIHDRGFFHSKWLTCVKNILTECGCNQLWLQQSNVPCSISKTIKAKLNDMFCGEWKDLVFNSSKCLNYRIFKQELKLEPYFDILPDDLSTAFCHFRSLNHRFPIEWGRIIRTARDDRICELCF